MFCKVCGKEIEENASFCSKCGAIVTAEGKGDVYTGNQNESGLREDAVSVKTKWAYAVAWISAVVSFLIRITMQDRYIYWDNLLDNVKVLGIDRETKPFITFIPAIAAVIVAMLIVGDTGTNSQKKKKALVVSAVLIALSLVFIWLDIPSEILSF